MALVDRDPTFKTDRLASVIADFGDGRQLSFVCGTQTRRPADRRGRSGTKGSLEIVIPFNAPPTRRPRILVGSGGRDRSLYRREIMPAIDQYTAQAENFALAVLGEQKLDYGVEDAISQMQVLDAIFRSEKSGNWENVR